MARWEACWNQPTNQWECIGPTHRGPMGWDHQTQQGAGPHATDVPQAATHEGSPMGLLSGSVASCYTTIRHTHIHTCTHKHTHACTHTCTNTCFHTPTRAQPTHAWTHVCTNMHTCTHKDIHILAETCTCTLTQLHTPTLKRAHIHIRTYVRMPIDT